MLVCSRMRYICSGKCINCLLMRRRAKLIVDRVKPRKVILASVDFSKVKTF